MLTLTDIPLAATALLAAFRAGGLMVFAPALSHMAVPWAVRLPLAAAIGVAAAGCGAPVPAIDSLPALLTAAVGEVAVGLAIGFAAGAILSGVEVAGGYISQQIGISLLPASPEAGRGGSGGAGYTRRWRWWCFFWSAGTAN